MSRTTFVTLLVLCATLVAPPASAWHRHRPRHRAQAYSPPPAYLPPIAGGWQAEAIARATARMQAAPGLTNELAPDAKETATGGPSGGVPGFDGL